MIENRQLENKLRTPFNRCEKDTFLKSLYEDKTPEYLKSELRYFAQEIRKLTSDLSGKNEDMVEKLMSQYNFDHI